MIGSDASPKLKIQYWTAVAAFIGGGIFALWLGLIDVGPTLRASDAGEPLIEFWPSAFRLLPPAVACFALAGMALAPKPQPTATRRKSSPTSRVAVAMLAIVLACIPLTFVAAPVGRGVMSDILTERGYRACPVTDGRRAPMRWAHTGVACPTEARE